MLGFTLAVKPIKKKKKEKKMGRDPAELGRTRVGFMEEVAVEVGLAEGNDRKLEASRGWGRCLRASKLRNSRTRGTKATGVDWRYPQEGHGARQEGDSCQKEIAFSGLVRHGNLLEIYPPVHTYNPSLSHVLGLAPHHDAQCVHILATSGRVTIDSICHPSRAIKEQPCQCFEDQRQVSVQLPVAQACRSGEGASCY